MSSWFRIENKNGESILAECAKDACGHIVIPDGVTHIAKGAFKNCNKISSLIVPNSVQRIGLNAFEGCTSLKKLVIPKASVTIIGGKKFIGRLLLTAID